MSNKSTIKLLIAFNDPNLEPEERDEQAQVLLKVISHWAVFWVES
jgi:hypothetical protein